MVGITALALVVMNDVGSQLGRLESGGLAYDETVFTGLHPDVWDTAEFLAAEEAWDLASEPEEGEASGGLPANALITVHVVADLAFALVYPMFVVLGLRKLGVSRTLAFELGFIMLAADQVENVSAWLALVGLDFTAGTSTSVRSFVGVGLLVPAGSWSVIFAFLTQLAGLLKWGAIAIAAVIGGIHVLRSDDEDTGHGGNRAVRELASRAGNVRRGAAQEPWTALAGIGVVVAFFVLLVALPAGGPLEQIPDVLRSQIDPPGGGFRWVFIAAIALGGLSVAAVVAAGFISVASHSRPPTPVRRWVVVAWSAGASMFWFLLGGVLEGNWRFVPWAPVVVTVAATVTAWLVHRARSISVASVSPRSVADDPWWRRVVSEVAEAAHEAFGGPQRPTLDEVVSIDRDADRLRMVAWIGALAGVVATAVSLGLVRATLLPALYASSPTWWIAGALIGALLAVTSGRATQLAVQRLHAWAGDMLVPVAFRIGLLSVALAIVLAVRPTIAPAIGSTGVLAIAIAAFSVIVAGLAWVGNRVWRWDVTKSLGLGSRTPWFLVLVAMWATASMLDSAGGYNDARLIDPPRFTDVDETDTELAADTVGTQFRRWLLRSSECDTGDGPRPLYLVAAPGGGIRAAYWTTTGLDQLFTSEAGGLTCGELGPFAVSGVSGGSVGATTWFAHTDPDPDGVANASSTIADMSKDAALAQAITGMLFRDLPQTITGLTDSWADRAELIERAWTQDGRFTVDGEELALSQLGRKPGWQPIVVLNGTSVNDGCRTILSNLALFTTPTGNCLDVPDPGDTTSPQFPAAFGLYAGLVERADQSCSDVAAEAKTVGAVTGALTSARFPLVTPSAAYYRCLPGAIEPMATYVVDGGYAENTGLLTLLQIWEQLEPHVRAHNARPGAVEVQPWIVLLDNHYRSTAAIPTPDRPRELVAPLLAFGAAGRITPESLEQTAAFEMSQACPEALRFADCRPTYLRIAPQVAPGPSAPLGWVLSRTSTEQLDDALRKALSAARTDYPDLFRPSGG